MQIEQLKEVNRSLSLVEIKFSLKNKVKNLFSEIKSKEVEIHTKIRLKPNLDMLAEAKVQILAEVKTFILEVKKAKICIINRLLSPVLPVMKAKNLLR